MSRSALKTIQAAAGNASKATYVDDVFSTFLYKGTGSSQAITNNIDLSGEGGMVWTKNRTQARNHSLYDTARGATKRLVTDGNGQELTYTDTLTAFNSDGFSLGADGSLFINANNEDYASWTFRKQPGFFDIVTYTGTGDTTGGSPQWREISHNLGVAPGMIIVKKTSGTGEWWVWHRGLPDDNAYAAQSGFLSQSAAFGGYVGFQTNANQTAAHFSLRQNSSGQTNDSGATYVAYLFAHDAQDFGTDSDEAIIKCGSYTGNGSSTGPTVDLGFEPQWLLFKKATGSAEEWIIHDNMRGLPVGGNDAELLPASSSQEYSSYAAIDLTATGFKITHTSARYNENSQTYIYMAIARPHKPASEFAATDLFKPSIYTGNGSTSSAVIDAPTSPQAIDLAFFKSRQLNGRNWEVITRLTGTWPSKTSTSVQPKGLHFNTTDSQADVWSVGSTNGRNITVSQDSNSNLNVNGESYAAWRVSRAPGFFDVVVYKGTNSATTISHNLGVAPEMIFLKNRGATEDWQLYLNAGGTEYGYYGTNQKYVGLNTSLSSWNNTSPTNSVVSIASGLSNASYSYVMYLFASVSGISKVGTYSGTGSELTVDCGFSAGARFVLIHRVDSSMGSGGESWFVFDTARGITASSSPYLPLNDTDAEESGSFVKPDSSGFKVTTESVVNTSGKTYVFYAIA